MNGALTVSGDAEVQNNTTLTSPAAITISGATRWSGGTIASSAGVQPLTLSGGVTLEGGSKTLTNRAATLNGTSTWTSGGLALQNATLVIPTGASLDASVSGALTATGASGVTVAGTLTKSGTTTTTLGADVAVSGTLAVQAGTLTTTAALTGTGRLIGAGTLDLTNATAYDVQTLAPGATGDGSTATLSVVGPLTLPAGGTLSLDVSGSASGQFDRLVVGSTLGLDGVLRIALATGFAPQDGERFVLATGNSVQGDFASTELPAGFTLDVTPTQVVLVAPTSNVDPSVIVWTGGGADDLWSTATNWDLNRAPIAGDTVRIDLDASANFTSTAAVDYAIGRLELSSQRLSLALNGTVAVAGDVTLARGFVSGTGALTAAGALTQSGGVLATATVQIDGPTTWTGGSMTEGSSTDGTTTLAGGGTFTPPPGSTFSQAELVVRGRTLRLGGVTDVTDGYIGLERGASLVVQAGATLRFSGDDESGIRPDDPTTPRATLVNDGVIVKTGGPGAFDETWIGGRNSNQFGTDYVDVSGTGTFRSNVGTLTLNVTPISTLGGTYEAAAGGRVSFSQLESPTAQQVISGTTRGAGRINFTGNFTHQGTHDVSGGTSMSGAVTFSDAMTLTSLGTLDSFFGTLRVEPSGTYALTSLILQQTDAFLTPDFDVAGRFSLTSGASMTGATVVADDMEWADASLLAGGTVTIRDSLTVRAGFEFSGGPYARLLSGRQLDVQNVAIWDSGDLTMDAGAVLNVASTADFQITRDAQFAPGAAPGDAQILNAGRWRKLGSGPFQDGFGDPMPQAFTQTAVGVPFANTGTIAADAGRLAFTSTLTSSGTIQGTDTLDVRSATVDQSGLLAPGTDGTASRLVVLGSFPTGGTLAVDLGGPTPADDYDVLAVSEAVTLGGTLRVRLVDGFVPSNDQRFTILTAPSVTGTFDALDLPGAGVAFTVEVTATTVDLVAQTSANAAPVAMDDAAATDEDTSVLIDVLANDTDADDDALTLAEITRAPTSGTATIESGQIRYTPSGDFAGADTLVYRVTDGTLSDLGQLIVTIRPVNDAPVAADDVALTSVGEAVFVEVLVNDADADGDALTVTEITQAPTNGTAQISDNGILYTPDATFAGADTLTYTVSDGSLSDTATLIVTVSAQPNAAPVAANDEASTDEDTSVLIDALANDSDPDDDAIALTEITQAPANGTATIENGQIRYTPAADFAGADTVTYQITDGALTDEAQLVVTVRPVNDAPIASDDQAATDEDTSVLIAVLANDTDVDGDALTVEAILTDPANGAAVVEDGQIRYTPALDFSGSDTLTYRASDGLLTSDARVVVTVRPVNDAPVAAADVAVTSVGEAVFADVLANDTDADGDALTVTEITQAPTNGTAQISDNGILYTPDATFAGADTLTYTVSDGSLTDATTLIVTVSAQPNTAPVAVDDEATTDEDTSVLVDVLANDTDAEGNPLALQQIVSAPAFGTATIEDGQIRYAPALDFAGADTLVYRVTDGALSDEAQLIVTVRPVNDAPIAADDAAQTTAGAPIVVDVLANDSDVDGDALTISSIPQAPANGVAAIEDGQIRYTPAAGFAGADTLTYRASDGSLTADARLIVTVSAQPNAAPVAVDDEATTDEDTSVLVDVLANDTDPNDDEVSVVEITRAPTSGTAAIEDGQIRYTPAADFSGADTLTYQITDGALTGEAQLIVTVRPVNDAPIASDDATQTPAGVSLFVDVLANDTDPEDDVLTITAIAQAPTNGTARIDDNGIVYQSLSTFAGVDSLRYTVSDPSGATAQATVRITVSSGNQAPIAAPDTVLASQRPVTFNPLRNDRDPDGDALRIVRVGQAEEGGDVTLVSDSLLTYVPATGFDGDDRFVYVVADGRGLLDSALVVVRVRPLRFAVTDLGTLGGDGARALGVSDEGHVVGASLTADGSVGSFLWQNGTMTALPLPDGATNATAYAVNADGVVAGYVQQDDAFAAIRIGTTDEVLAGLGGRSAIGYAISPDGAVAGMATDAAGRTQAVVWSGDASAPPATVGASPTSVGSEAYGLNPDGLAVGVLLMSDGASQAFRGQSALPGEGRAYAVNAAGQVAGSTRQGDQVAPVVWEADGQARVLDALDNGFGEAYALNDAGWIVGTLSGGAASSKNGTDRIADWRSELASAPDDRWNSRAVLTGSVSMRSLSKSGANEAQCAFLHLDGTTRDLNTLIDASSGWQLVEARGVSADGRIVGWGLLDGSPRAFVLDVSGNTPPSAQSDAVAARPGQSVVLDVLANDSDRDGDQLRIASVTQPAEGSATLDENEQVVYTPPTGFFGVATFAYTVADGHGGLARASVEVDVAAPIPSGVVLDAASPNPARDIATIRYALPVQSDVRLTLFDVRGRTVRVIDSGVRPAGPNEVRVPLGEMSAGVYWYRLEVGGAAHVRSVIVVR